MENITLGRDPRLCPGCLRVRTLTGGTTRKRNVDLKPTIVGGAALLCAARVEPVVKPGQIWATEEFREQFLQRPSLWRTTPVIGPTGEDRFNVKKDGGAEPDLWVRLYRLEF